MKKVTAMLLLVMTLATTLMMTGCSLSSAISCIDTITQAKTPSDADFEEVLDNLEKKLR